MPSFSRRDLTLHGLCASAIPVSLLLVARQAHAGMPVILLADVARLRLQTISFFLAVIVVSTFVVRALWNRLRRDLPGLPLLSVKGAFAAVLLWGLAVNLVLVMIAGGRELLTPGAWEPQGVTRHVKLRAAPPDAQLAHARLMQLERLRSALWAYAAANGGQFPPDDLSPGVAEATWRTVDPSGIHYAYAPGATPDQDARPVAWEPGTFGPKRYVLDASGGIRLLGIEEIRAAVGKKVR